MSGKVKSNHDANQVHLSSFTNWRNGGLKIGQLAERNLADWRNENWPIGGMMVLTGTGAYAYKRKDGIWVVPVGCLKQ